MFSNLKLFFSILGKKEINKIIVLFFLVLFSIFLEMLGLSLILPIISTLIDSQNQYTNFIKSFFKGVSDDDILYLIILLLIIVYLLKNLYLTFISFFQNNYINQLSGKISTKLFSKYLGYDLVLHTKKRTTQMIQNVIFETQQLINVYFRSGLNFFTELMIILGISIILLIIEPVGFFVSILIFGVSGFFFYFFTRNYLIKWGEKRQKYQEASMLNLQESLKNIKNVKILNLENLFKKNFENNLKESLKSGTYLQFLSSLPKYMLEFIGVLTVGIFILYLNYTFETFQELILIVGIFIAAAFKLLPSINRMVGSYQHMKFSVISIKSIYKDINLGEQESKKVDYKKNQFNFDKRINFVSVSFSYDKGHKVLDNINIIINKNQMIGLVGLSGSGKTTFIDLITGLIKPSSGSIEVDNKNINLDIKQWQKNIGYLSQNIFITDGSIADNISFDSEERDEQKIYEALKKSGLEQYIKNSNSNISTLVGEDGARISEGQKQRLGLARIIYRNPKFLILDEPTSSLDKETEKFVVNNINELKGLKTILISTHNEEILKKCDLIYQIKNKNLYLKNI